MTDTSVDTGQLKQTVAQLRDIAENKVEEFAAALREVPRTYQEEAAANVEAGVPAGVFRATVDVLESGVADSVSKTSALKAMLLRLADQLEGHAGGVESDEADSAQQLTYGS